MHEVDFDSNINQGSYVFLLLLVCRTHFFFTKTVDAFPSEPEKWS
jgi:hypothetical protein